MGTLRGIVAVVAGCGALLSGMVVGPLSHAVTIDWVTVGDPGNAADTDPAGYGAVADSFRIMKFEFTNQHYTAFLNSVAAADPYFLYNANMGSNARGGITRSGVSGSYAYSVRANMGDKPVNYVSWFDAARVANWLMNGASPSSSTETGAYTLGGATSGYAPARNPGATFAIPTENEWYKAAYYKGGSANAGYWTYAVQSDAAPTWVTSGPTGSGSAGSTGAFANYEGRANWNGVMGGNVTTVGTNGGPSAYGAFDMTGNVSEWNDLAGVTGALRGVRGGSWGSGTHGLSPFSRTTDVPTLEDSFWGFRLASPVRGPAPIPEIDPIRLATALAVIACAVGLRERRRPVRVPPLTAT